MTARASADPAGIESAFYRDLIDLVSRTVFADSTGQIGVFYREVCRLASQAVCSSGAALFFTESNGEAVISIAAHDAARLQNPGRRFQRGEGVAGAALVAGHLQIHTAARPHPAFHQDDAIQSIAAIPFSIENEPVSGVLCVQNREGGEFSESDLRLLERLEATLAPLLKIVRFADQMNETNRRLKESADRSAALYTLATLVGDHRPLEELLDETIHAVTRLYRFEQGAIYLDEGDRLEAVAARGLSAPFEVGTQVYFGAAEIPPGIRGDDRLLDLVRRAAQGRRAWAIEGERHRGGILRGRLAPAAAAPLETGGRVIGVLLVGRGFEDDRSIEEPELANLGAFVSHVALLIDQVRGAQVAA